MNQQRMWIMVAGPYKADTKTESERQANLSRLNQAAVEVFKKGHVPIIGVNMALPMIEAAGSHSYSEIMMPLSLSLCDRCDAILRIGGESAGADQELIRFRERGKIIFKDLNEIPSVAGTAD